MFWLPTARHQLKETGFLFKIGFDLLSLAPGQNGASLVLILDMVGLGGPATFKLGSKGQLSGEINTPKRY